ncbi:MAG: YfhO family protein, partial [Lacrimispora sphenoides]
MSFTKLNEKKVYILSAILPVLGMCIIFLYCGIYPLGKTSNLASDLYYQYIDYFGWLRNVLTGEAELTYSFSMSLGNQTVGLYAYYLSSPLNLLVYFFPKEQLPLFVFVITLVKISLCGASFAYFARSRFNQCKDSYVIVASLAYSLMQYNIAQLTNIMWLDGVYLIPLMLAGVYQFITKGKHQFFCFTIFLSILFNWYTAYMNCLFVVLYYLYERFLYEKNINITKFIKDFLAFIFYEFLGVLSSSFFFLPVILAMVKGKADFGTEDIFKIHNNGNIYDLKRGFMFGNTAPDTTRQLSLYCGYFIFAFVIF